MRLPALSNVPDCCLTAMAGCSIMLSDEKLRSAAPPRRIAFGVAYSGR